MTLREAYVSAASRLAQEPLLHEFAARDAASLLLHSMALGPTTLYAHPARLLSEQDVLNLHALVDRRLTFEPMQYILGEQEFYGLPFQVSPATLIPRPETELLVEAVLHRLPQGRELVLADIGTGSGAIAISLAYHLPQAEVFAFDLSSEALSIALENAGTNGVASRVHFRVSDLLEASPPEQTFDAVVSNPPYIPESDGPALHPQVRNHEPSSALFAGRDGLDILRRLVPQAWTALKPGGLLAMEFGFGQSTAMCDLLKGWSEVELLKDLQNVPRVALGRKT